MKHLLTALLITVSISAVAQTESQTEPQCGETSEVLNALMTEYKEQPIWVGRTDKGINYGIFANIREKSWTMIQYNDKITCLVLTGSESAVFPEPTPANRVRTATPD